MPNNFAHSSKGEKINVHWTSQHVLCSDLSKGVTNDETSRDIKQTRTMQVRQARKLDNVNQAHCGTVSIP